MLSTSPNTESRPSIEKPTVNRSAEDVQGVPQESTIPAEAFEARWARATVTSVDLTLAKAADMSFESRWAQAIGRPVSLAVSGVLARREVVIGSDTMQFAKATPAETLTPANAGRVPLQVATAAPPLLASAPEKRATPPETSNKLMSMGGRGSRTAVYDISARTVYLPNGEKLEAHSGLGEKMDDPHYANIRMRGPTPPNVYDLTLREELFHGVRAIRLNPIDDGKMFGRTGMLAHTYMLGPNGQSNGCVSFRDYPKFLQAFLRGDVDRLVVVPNLVTESSRIVRARHGRILRYAFNNR